MIVTVSDPEIHCGRGFVSVTVSDTAIHCVW